ncbi:mannitol dehydrogenase family protein [Demequina rhizosphaerae]|uniref:mannitol dehydrogenase family protein n=1 Tax=Demequina rhizosphaerae TaxID=1638985 RepID=UPI0007846467|nr:mannitol dehydrogenase family protein [Demequina rhizosphaerae]
MTPLPRLDRRTLDSLVASGLDPAVRVPATASRDLATGIVHLGIGAFHRAHQAVFTERAAAATGDDRWGIHGVTQRSASVRDQLLPQGGLYGVLEVSDDGRGRASTVLDLVGSVRDVSYPAEDTARVLATIAAPTTHIVSLTVTEKGYRRAADGGPDLADPALAFDLGVLAHEIDGSATDDREPSRSAIGLLVRALAHRWRAGAEPLSVVVCDNLLDNGPQVEALVHALVAACPAAASSELLDWIRSSVAFPATMVDRIVPATTDAHRRVAERLLGATDAGLVVAEPFRQWVIQDRFAGPRPAWELAGATLTADVTPYEQTKLRLLNGTHSMLAYAGALRGHTMIADAVADPVLHDLARALIDEDSMPSLGPDTGIDLEAYRDSVLERFANAAIGHTTVQVAMDGSQKLPIRLLGIARDRLAAGHVPHAAARAVAAWMLYVRAASSGTLEVGGAPVALDDPAAARLGNAAAGSVDGLADRLLDSSGVFPADLAEDDRWRAAVRAGVTELDGLGAVTPAGV